ncbi:MAG: HTH domain-containing protein, partial [Bacteroidetes bacterium]|nr:HTH domain-containing protein [Bacteroidota bacterium]
DNPKITTTELSEKLNVTRMTIHRDLDDLKAIERIKRIGPDKGGYWEVKK